MDDGRAIAKKVLDVLDRREKEAAVGNKRLDVWDYATRVEGLIDVGKSDEAATALTTTCSIPA